MDRHQVQVPAEDTFTGKYSLLVINLTPPLGKANISTTTSKLGDREKVPMELGDEEYDAQHKAQQCR